MLRERLEQVESRIADAARRSGRRREDITLIAVTKIFPASLIREAHALGVRHFGENYVQEFEGKFPEVSHLPEARFHLVGHLQSNKAKRAVQLFDAIDAVDSPRLARWLEEAPLELHRRAGSIIQVMIEVKLSEEEGKSGARPEDLPALIEVLGNARQLELTGLMIMPPWSQDPQPSRPYFRRLRELAERFRLPHLSMGMSHDLEVAIEEGATQVRVGTALFGLRKEA